MASEQNSNYNESNTLENPKRVRNFLSEIRKMVNDMIARAGFVKYVSGEVQSLGATGYINCYINGETSTIVSIRHIEGMTPVVGDQVIILKLDGTINNAVVIMTK